MKKSVRMMALAMALLMVGMLFVACGNMLSGTYATDEVFGSKTTLKFSGKNVEITMKALGQEIDPIKGTYEIKDDKITIKLLDDEDEGLGAAVKALLDEFLKEQSFEKDGDTIKIGGTKYTKQ